MVDQVMSSDPQPWRVLSTRREFENRWAGILIDEVELPGGERYEYTRLRPAGMGVAVIGFDEAGRVLLEREYRHGVGQVVWQLPGGLADGGEDLRTAGLRELSEETGYAPALVDDETVRYLGVIWDNPGLGRGQSNILAAWGLVENDITRRDPAEYVALHWVTTDWLKEAVGNGEIRDRVVVAAVAYLMVAGLI